MPWIAFLANCFWLMVIGLLGPSIPSIIVEFGLDYTRAGLIFTLLSAGSLLGSLIGGVASDYSRRKQLWAFFSITLASGLVLVGFVPSFTLLLFIIFFMSLLGGPIGAVGQSIMLQMFPQKRTTYLSLSTMFAAAGSFIAPLILALVFIIGGTWRTAFFTVSGFVFVLFILILFTKLPVPVVHQKNKIPLKTILADKSIVLVGSMIFLGVGLDFGFSYWLSEYFTTVVGSAPVFSSIAVSVYLGGVIFSRFALSCSSNSDKIGRRIITGLALSAISLILFLNIPFPAFKLLFSVLYGIGIGPLFPFLLSKGTGLYPGKPGAVTGILFAAMSFSGMVFPFVIGLIGNNAGIEGAYYSLFAVGILITGGVLAINRFKKQVD